MSSIGSFERISNDEVDPVADFVAREQNLLAELDDSSVIGNPFGAINENSLTANSVSQFESIMEASDSFDPFGVQQANSIKLESDHDLFALKSPTNDSVSLETKVEPEPVAEETDEEPTFMNEAEIVQPMVQPETIETDASVANDDATVDDDISNTNCFSDSNSNVSNSAGNSIESNGFVKVHSMASEPETMIRWREIQRERLEQKDAKEKAANEKLKNEAKSELDDWYETYQKSLEKRKQNNRDAQEQFEQERDTTKPGQDWVKVASYCDFTNKSAQGRDLSRMRACLLKQKQFATSGSSQELDSEQ